MATSRRQFIKISALGLSGVALSASSYSLAGTIGGILNNEDPHPSENLTKHATYCEVCFWKCAAWTHVNDKGDIVKIIGNDIDPHCNGRLCPRGTGGVGMYNDPDRLKTPLIREKTPNGDTFREATWDEALDLIASKMKDIKAKYGSESFALLKHGSSGKHFEHLFKAYGSNTFGEPAYAQCRGPREAAFNTTFGTWIGSPEPTDIQNTKCLVLIGSHIGENMHNSQVQEVAELIDKKGTIITVDPRASTIASKSKYWLAIKPATDLALLLAWMNVIINENLYNPEYIKKNTVGFDELKAHVQQYSPEWASEITSLPVQQIIDTAREMAHAAPAVIVHPGRHVSWYGDDTQRGRAVAILNGILGSWGQKGGFYNKEKIKVPKYPHPRYPKSSWTWKTMARKYPLAQMGLTQEIIRSSIPEENTPFKVKAWMVSGTNLVSSIPNQAQLFKAIDALDFLVVVDTMPMDITGYADVVLPECTYLERYDSIRAATNREPSIALRAPAVKPKFNSQPSWWMAKQLGHRLGLGKFFQYKNYEQVLNWQLKKMGTSLAEMKKIGVKKFPRKSGPLYDKKGDELVLKTPSRKIELYSKSLNELGFDPLPKFTKHAEPKEGFYRLIYGRAPMHTFSRTVNNPQLADLMDTNNVWVNPKVAEKWGLKNGQEVYLKNQDGVISSFPIKVRVTERIRWDSVYMVHGFGHKDKRLNQAFGRGVNDSELISEVKVDPIMGGTGMRGNFVTFVTEQTKTVDS